MQREIKSVIRSLEPTALRGNSLWCYDELSTRRPPVNGRAEQIGALPGMLTARPLYG
jgi:hypothetical protein